MNSTQKTKQSIKNAIVAVTAAALLAAPGAALAHRGNNDGGRGNSNRNNSTQRDNSQRSNQNQNNRRGPIHHASLQRGSWSKDDDNQRGGRWWGDWRYDNDRDNNEDPNSCEKRQARANKQTDRLEKASEYMLGRLSWQIDTQQKYVMKHNLEPENFGELTVTANTDKSAAQAAINALEAPEIDCSQPVENDKAVLQANKKPVVEALRVYNIDAVNITYAVQAAR